MIEGGLVGEIFRLALRWVHAIAAIAWVGGAIFYWLALRPALRTIPLSERSRFEQAVARSFREIVQTGVFVLLITGVIMSVDRLSAGVTGAAYVAVLVLKIALSLVMFGIAWQVGRRDRRTSDSSTATPDRAPARRSRPRPADLILWLGLIVVLLALILRALFEAGLRAAT